MTMNGKEIEIVKMIVGQLKDSQKEELVYFLKGPEEPTLVTDTQMQAYSKMLDNQQKENAKLQNSNKQQSVFI